MRRQLALSLILLGAPLVACDGGHPPAVSASAPIVASTGQSAAGSVHPPGWGSTPRNVRLPQPLLGGSTSTATMFDSVNLREIPAGAFAAAGYVAGSWPTWTGCASCGGSIRGRFPHAHGISIAIHADERAACLDDEPGDATPSQAGSWVVADIKAGFVKPCVYSDLSEMPSVQSSLRAWLGSGWRTRVFLWLAWYRHIAALVSGYDAVQYDDKCLGRNLDCSTVSLAFLQIAQPPYAPPKPKPRLACFGPHAQLHNKTCERVRPRVASWSRARDASHRVLASAERTLRTSRCRRPYRRGVCVRNGRLERVMRQRITYFQGQIDQALKRYA